MWNPFSSQTRSNSRRPRNTRARRTSLERLEERQLLSYADFELSSLLPANGGDGSKGFVINGIVDKGSSDNPVSVTSPSATSMATVSMTCSSQRPGRHPARSSSLSDAYLIFGRPGGFSAELDLNTLDGTTGYAIHDAVAGRRHRFRGRRRRRPQPRRDPRPGPRGELRVPFARPAQSRPDVRPLRRHAHLASLDLADGTHDGQIDLSSLDGTHGFVINGVAAADARGRGQSGWATSTAITWTTWSSGRARRSIPAQAYVVFGRDSTAGKVFPAVLELATLDGSNGFSIPGPSRQTGAGSPVGGTATSTAMGSGTWSSAHYMARPRPAEPTRARRT